MKPILSYIKRLIKFAAKNSIFKLSFFKHRLYWGYHLISLKVLLVNWVFQRIFRINSDCPWSVSFTSRVLSPENISIGKNCGKAFAVSGSCYIQGFNGVKIGDNTIFSYGVAIVSANHSQDDLNKSVSSKPIVIGESCWLGFNSTILPAVTLGNNCIVGAGSVVTKSFPDNSIIAGNPARLIRLNDVTKLR